MPLPRGETGVKLILLLLLLLLIIIINISYSTFRLMTVENKFSCFSHPFLGLIFLGILDFESILSLILLGPPDFWRIVPEGFRPFV